MKDSTTVRKDNLPVKMDTISAKVDDKIKSNSKVIGVKKGIFHNKQPVETRPNNIRTSKVVRLTSRTTDLSTTYNSQEFRGVITFDYSNNNGRFTIGKDQLLFETMWSKKDNTSIYAYKDSPTIKTIALVTNNININEIKSGSSYDASSRVRTPQINEIIIWQNVNGYFAATKILNVKDRTRGALNDELTFEYVINVNGTDSFLK